MVIVEGLGRAPGKNTGPSSQLAQPAQLGGSYPAVLLAPDVEGRIADAHLATDLLDADPQLRLLERERDLFVGELALSHDMPPGPLRPSSCRAFSVTERYGILGQGH